MWRVGLFAGLFVALSSTAIVLKELGTLNQLDSPHGRLVVGVMLFQDLCIVGLLLFVPILSGHMPLSVVPEGPGKDWSRHRCGLAGQPFRSAGALPAGRAQRTGGRFRSRCCSRASAQPGPARCSGSRWRLARSSGGLVLAESESAIRPMRKSGRFATSSQDSSSSRWECWSTSRPVLRQFPIILAIALLLVLVKASVATGAFLPRR